MASVGVKGLMFACHRRWWT